MSEISMISKRVSLGADFGRRVLTASIGGVVILGLIGLGTPIWDAAVMAVALLCVWELQRMISPNVRTDLVAMLSIMLATFLCFRINNYALVTLLILLYLIFQVIKTFTVQSSGLKFLMRYFVYTTLGTLYVCIPLSMFLGVRSLQHGAAWTIITFVSNWATDSCALIGGRLVGRTKLAPQISPGKTVEGALLGLVGGFLIGILMSLLMRVPTSTAVLVNLAIPVLTILGDLLESWIKRRFAVKDTSSLLPGHGGFLDRTDGLLLAGPIVYLIILFVR